MSSWGAIARASAVALLIALPACKSDSASTPASEPTQASAASQPKPDGPEWPERPAEGDPVVVRFVSVNRAEDDPRATMHVFNFADVAIRGIHMELSYLDKDEAVIKTFPWSQVGPDLVAPKAHALQQMGAFLPAETESVRAAVHRVEFTDGTEWRRSESEP